MASEPPPLPPVFPGQAPPGLTQGLLLEGRLHPLTLIFSAWHTVRGLLIPLIVIVLFGRRRAEDAYLPFVFLVLVLPLGLATIRYFTFTYKIQNGELITHQGVLGRTQRIIPLSRVQDIRIDQSVLHRLFRMADVHVETAGGKEPEASLSVLSLAEAEGLRRAIFDLKGLSSAVAPEPAAREIIRQLTLRELLLAGVTSNQVASAVAVLLVVWRLLDEFMRPELYQRWIERSTEAAAAWLTQLGSGAWLVFSFFFIAAIAV